MRLPLNIFEERYKLMLKRCLDDSSPFGVVLISKGHESGEPAEPFAVGTTARIMSIEETEDGRFLLGVEGGIRFRIDEQLHRYPYISASVSPYPYEVGDLDRRLVDEVQQLYREFGMTALAMTGQWVRRMEVPGDAEELINFVGARLSSANVAKQRILEAPTMGQQMELARNTLRGECNTIKERFRNQQSQRWWTLSATN